MTNMEEILFRIPMKNRFLIVPSREEGGTVKEVWYQAEYIVPGTDVQNAFENLRKGFFLSFSLDRGSMEKEREVSEQEIRSFFLTSQETCRMILSCCQDLPDEPLVFPYLEDLGLFSLDVQDEIEEREITPGVCIFTQGDTTTFIPLVKYLKTEDPAAGMDFVINPYETEETNEMIRMVCREVVDGSGAQPLSGVSDLEVPEGVRELRAGCFDWLPDLEDILLPESILGISPDAFQDLKNLTSLRIPAALSELCRLCVDPRKVEIVILKEETGGKEHETV